MGLKARAHQFLQRYGYELHRSDASVQRRGRQLAAHGVDFVIDVGAATGRYATQLRSASYIGPILSFEPLIPSFQILQSASAADPHWTAINMAVGRRVGPGEINVAGNSDSSSLLPMLDLHHEIAPDALYVGTQVTTVTTLDHEAERWRSASAPFLKMDVQGLEGEVLDGAAACLPGIIGIQIELSLLPLYEGGMLYDEAIDRVHAAGFRMADLEPEGFDPTSGRLLWADGIFFRR